MAIWKRSPLVCPIRMTLLRCSIAGCRFRKPPGSSRLKVTVMSRYGAALAITSKASCGDIPSTTTATTASMCTVGRSSSRMAMVALWSGAAATRYGMPMLRVAVAVSPMPPGTGV